MFIFFLMKLKKWFTLVEMLIVVVIIGIIAAAIIPRLQEAQEYNKEKQKIHKEMPKTYEFALSNNIIKEINPTCTKDTTTKERVSDESCYNRLRVLEKCKEKMKDGKDYPILERLLSLVENEQQADAIINKCENYKQEIPQVVQQESHENDEKINKLLDSF